MGKDDYLAITEPQRREKPHCLSDRKRDYRLVVLLMIMGRKKKGNPVVHRRSHTKWQKQAGLHSNKPSKKINYKELTWAQWGTEIAPPGQRALRAHWPRTKVYHLLMTLAACTASCCRQVISFQQLKPRWTSSPALWVWPHMWESHTFPGTREEPNWS